MLTAAMFILFSERFLNMCKPRAFYLLWWAGTSGLAFYGSEPVCLLSWFSMVNTGWLGSLWSEVFLQMKFVIFQGCSTKPAPFLPEQPASYNQLLIQPLLFVQILTHFFLRMQFLLAAMFFFSIFSHLLCYKFLTFIWFNIWRWKSLSISSSHLELVTWHFLSQMVFPNI